MDRWPLISRLPLAAMPNAAFWARRHTESKVNEWSLRAPDTDLGLIVTELVSNAVKATGSLSATTRAEYTRSPIGVPYAELVTVRCVLLRLLSDRKRLLIEVWDRSDEPPVERIPDFENESGRGLFLVAAFCDKWGWYPSDVGGKIVWAEATVNPVQ